MSITLTPATTTSLQSIVKQYDTNSDGSFSLDEFASFLDDFIASVTGQSDSTSTSATATTSLLATSTSSTSTATESDSESRLDEPLPDCPLGWNAEKWYDESHTTVKYVAGRVLARYEPSEWVNEDTRELILADLKRAGLNPTAAGNDCVDFNDGYGLLDVVQSASTGGKAWQWIPADV